MWDIMGEHVCSTKISKDVLSMPRKQEPKHEESNPKRTIALSQEKAASYRPGSTDAMTTLRAGRRSAEDGIQYWSCFIYLVKQGMHPPLVIHLFNLVSTPPPLHHSPSPLHHSTAPLSTTILLTSPSPLKVPPPRHRSPLSSPTPPPAPSSPVKPHALPPVSPV